jgi:5'-3' exonuclease
MEKLGARLSQLCKVQKWVLSDTSEPGEGEQKCMKFWRKQKELDGSVVIYGLDADLILLCLLTQQLTGAKHPVWCIRETAEWEGGKDKGLAEFMRLSIDVLHSSMRNPNMDKLQWTLDYVGGMSFLGNDFVPHSMTMKIREGAHDRLVWDLKRLHEAGKKLVHFVDGIGWTYNPQSVLELVNGWSSQEEKLLLEFIKKKGYQANQEDWQMEPCTWKVEEKTLCKSRGCLYEDWEARMIEEWFGPIVKEAACKEYVQGLQWILDYYTQQRDIDPLWFYPWSLPPTWKSLKEYLVQKGGLLFESPSSVKTTQIQPQEQLAMVLPLESWRLIRNQNLKNIPTKLPYLWPKKYGFFSAGKTFLWECETEIPLLLLPTLRSVS